jgi:hypothetical protein
MRVNSLPFRLTSLTMSAFASARPVVVADLCFQGSLWVRQGANAEALKRAPNSADHSSPLRNARAASRP